MNILIMGAYSTSLQHGLEAAELRDHSIWLSTLGVIIDTCSDEPRSLAEV
jgi:hypothetical protein